MISDLVAMCFLTESSRQACLSGQIEPNLYRPDIDYLPSCGLSFMPLRSMYLTRSSTGGCAISKIVRTEASVTQQLLNERVAELSLSIVRNLIWKAGSPRPCLLLQLKNAFTPLTGRHRGIRCARNGLGANASPRRGKRQDLVVSYHRAGHCSGVLRCILRRELSRG